MHLVCESCDVAYSGKRTCPRCGNRLIAPTEAHVPAADRFHFVPHDVGTSAASRVLAGSAAILGLVLGFKEILAGMLPAIGETDAWWQSDFAFVVLLGIRVVAGLFGGMLAGAGREKGLPIGLMAGAIAGGVLIAMEAFAPGGKVALGAMILAGTTAIVGLVSGAIGGKIWPPRSELPKANLLTKSSSIMEKAKNLQDEEEKKKLIPTQWARVILGVSLTICGFVAAEMIRNVVSRNSGGLIDLGGTRNIPYTCLEISAVIALLGGLASGASTGAGFRHGVFTGLIAGLLMAGLFGMRGPQKLPAAAGLLETLDWSPEKTPPIRSASAIFGAGFAVGSIGGLFGGILFPPLARKPKTGKPGDIGSAPQQTFAD